MQKKTSTGGCGRERMTDKKVWEAGVPVFTPAPRPGSSIVFPTSLSVSDRADVDGDSSAPSEDVSNTSASVWPTPRELKDTMDNLRRGKEIGNTGAQDVLKKPYVHR